MNQEKPATNVPFNVKLASPNTNVRHVPGTEKMHQSVTAQMATMTTGPRLAPNAMTTVPPVPEVPLDVSHALEITSMHQTVSHHHQKPLLLQLLTSQSDQLRLSHVTITVTLVNSFQAIA
jgi:hypothetical protein